MKGTTDVAFTMRAKGARKSFLVALGVLGEQDDVHYK